MTIENYTEKFISKFKNRKFDGLSEVEIRMKLRNEIIDEQSEFAMLYVNDFLQNLINPDAGINAEFSKVYQSIKEYEVNWGKISDNINDFFQNQFGYTIFKKDNFVQFLCMVDPSMRMIIDTYSRFD